MDTSAYDTNTLLLNHVSSVTFRVYEPRSDQSQSVPTVALEVENSLRNQGHIVHYDTNRGVLWHFQLNVRDKTSETTPATASAIEELSPPLFTLLDQGSIDPATLHKGRTHSNAPDSASPTTSAAASSESAPRFALPPKPHSPDKDIQLARHTKGDNKLAVAALPSSYENFVAAFLTVASTQLATATRSLMVNYRTILFPFLDATELEPAALCTLNAYLTTSGSLVLTVNVQRCEGLAAHRDPDAVPRSPTGHQLLTAPFGLLAIDQASEYHQGGSGSLAPTPATQALSVRGQADYHTAEWRQACSKALHFRGVDASMLERCTWSNIAVLRRPGDFSSTTNLAWPSPLCLRRRAVPVTATSRIDHGLLKGHEESHDPLGQAKSWYSASHEREEKVAGRKADRIVADARDNQDSGGSRASRAGPDPSTALNMNRPGPSSASHMYPTPPDGIQPPTGVTPSFDQAVMSPGNPPSATAGLDVDAEMTNMNSDAKAGEAFVQDPSDTEDASKRDRSGSNMLDSADDMFGDMEADIFGENEMNDITEDDFNFFDEVGDQPLGSVPELAMTEAPNLDVAIKREASVEAAPAHEPETVASHPQMGEAPASPVFAKPELRHARSSLHEEASRGGTDNTSRFKRESSPFNPDTVFKRVRASLSAAGPVKADMISEGTGRRSSVFGKVSFDPTLPLISKKYEQGGAFDFDYKVAKEKPGPQSASLMDAEQLKKRVRGSKRSKDPAGKLLRRFTAVDPSTAHPSPTKLDESASDDENSSEESDHDDSSFTTEDPSSPAKASVKRARHDDDIASQVASLKETEYDDEPEAHSAIEVPRLSRLEKPELRISRLFMDPEPLALDLLVPDEELIHLAQILTDQAATGSLDVCNIASLPSRSKRFRSLQAEMTRRTQNALHAIQNAGIIGFDHTKKCKLKDVIETQDALVTGQPNRLQPRPIPGREPFNDMKASNFYTLPHPHLELRRADSKLSILPTAVMFWESLGLSPISGTKNILAACVFPSWKGVSDNVSTFLGRLKSMYELLRLGTFSKLDFANEAEAGLVPYEVERISTSPDATMTANSSALIDGMEPLRQAVETLSVSDTNLVLYFACSPSNPASVIEACAAFQHFFDFYKKVLSSKRDVPRNELVLQLVSLDSLSSPTSLVLTPSNELMRISLETYDRCTSFTQPMPAPAITLEQPIPRHINFDCSPKASASVTHEHASMHIAYAQSVDERWVTAAWTDDRGRQQDTASFCLGRKGKPLSTSMNDVVHEIWESTLDLISTWKVQWRVVIAKCGPMDEDELKFWVDLARTQDKEKARISLTLISVRTDPCLQIFPAAAKIIQPAAMLGPTPVTTPQASVVSPDHIATPATPARDPTAGTSSSTPGADAAADPEPDSSLLDSVDQTWVALLAHRLSISPNATELQPALLSGYLLKRTGPNPDDPPAVLEVNLVHADISPRQYETSLREILSWYGALGTLARARGVVGREADVRPWHVAAAEKAVRALYLLL